MKPLLILPFLLAAAIPAGHAQTAAPDSRPTMRLPDPPVADDAPPSAFVAAARTAIAEGRIGEAIEAVERAESRILIRSVRPSRAATPSDQALVRLLTAARGLLAQGARAEALARLIEVQADPALDAPVE